MAPFPELAPHEGSWVVTLHEDPTVIGETFTRKIAEARWREGHRVETIGSYLARINAQARTA